MNRYLLMKNAASTIKVAQVFDVPIVHSTVNVGTGENQPPLPPLAELLEDNPPVDRTSVNSWEDVEFVEAVRATGRRKLVICALWTEICMAFTALDALRDGYEVPPRTMSARPHLRGGHSDVANLDTRRSQMESPIELVRRFCAAWSSDMGSDDLAAFFTDDAVYHNIPLPPVTGRENIADNLDSYIRPGAPGVEGIDFQLLNIAADGPVVLTERWDVFKLSDTSFGLAVMGTFEVRDGKISAWRDYFDMTQFVTLMGDHPLVVDRKEKA